jgi:hypothetical protein
MLRRQWKIGLATFGVSLGYFFVVTNLVMPEFAEQRYAYWRLYQDLGNTPREMVEHVVRHPIRSLELLVSTAEKRHTITLMFGSFAYLPLLSWPMWPMLFVTLAERFWGTGINLWLFRFHYQVVMTTVFFVATLYVLQDVRHRFTHSRRLIVVASMMILMATAWAVPASGVWEHAFTSAPAAIIETWRAALGRIPPAAGVSAQDIFVPHLSHRVTIYQFPRVREAEYIILDPQTPTWPATPDEIRTTQQRLPRLGWRIVSQHGTFTIFQRTPESRNPPPTVWK